MYCRARRGAAADGRQMARLVAKRRLAEGIFRVDVEAPHVARAALPGQFVMVRVDEKGERFPLTIFRADGPIVSLVFQVVGVSTRKLAAVPVGGDIANIAGPLGRPTHIERFGVTAVVAGGVGAAMIHAVAAALKAAGNRVLAVTGARSAGMVVLEKEMREVSDELVVCTDDGSYGRRGVVTEALAELMEATNVDRVFAAGPVPMMKAVVEVCNRFEVPVTVSLNPIMVDGTGMCGGCRVHVGGKVRFACVDGPDFDGTQVDFDELMLRLGMYRGMEERGG